MPPDGLAFLGHARDHVVTRGIGSRTRWQQVFPADQQTVRAALGQAMAFLRGLDFGQDQCGPVELVLAEAVNNVIEHAYAGQSGGLVELSIGFHGDSLDILILDDGLPMPDGQAPDGEMPDLGDTAEDLPEGGFGWFLIRELTHDLHYTRCGTRNRLRFRIDLGRS